jgi:hypothetical protein
LRTPPPNARAIAHGTQNAYCADISSECLAHPPMLMYNKNERRPARVRRPHYEKFTFYVKGALPLIQVIAGKKGSGKTKRIIDMANKAVQESKHDIIFIDNDNRYMFDLRHEVRFINAGEYSLDSDKMFMGFLAGAVAQNFDVGLILIDGFKRLILCELASTEWLFERLEALSEKHSVDFVLSISEDPEALPAFIQKYVI